MSLLHKAIQLKKNNELFRTRCEQRLYKLSREKKTLEESEKSLVVQIEGLRQLLITSQINAQVILPEQLRAILQKQSVFHRRIQELQVQLLQLKMQRDSLLKEYIVQQKKRFLFLQKEEKYNRWLFFQKKKMQKNILKRDEIEQEDNVNGKYHTVL